MGGYVSIPHFFFLPLMPRITITAMAGRLNTTKIMSISNAPNFAMGLDFYGDEYRQKWYVSVL